MQWKIHEARTTLPFPAFKSDATLTVSNRGIRGRRIGREHRPLTPLGDAYRIFCSGMGLEDLAAVGLDHLL